MFKCLCCPLAAIICCCLLLPLTAPLSPQEVPEYIKPCRRNDPELTSCFRGALEHLKPYLASGIPEIKLPSVEPFKMDSLPLQLDEGLTNYKITLKNMQVYGASNFKVLSMELGGERKPFRVAIRMPRLLIDATYMSSGVLLIIPASGGGDFHAKFGDVLCNATGRVSTHSRDNATFLHVDELHIDLNVGKVDMRIERAFKGNKILLEGTNNLLRNHGNLILDAMKPQLPRKLAAEFKKLSNQLLEHVPREMFYID